MMTNNEIENKINKIANTCATSTEYLEKVQDVFNQFLRTPILCVQGYDDRSPRVAFEVSSLTADSDLRLPKIELRLRAARKNEFDSQYYRMHQSELHTFELIYTVNTATNKYNSDEVFYKKDIQEEFVKTLKTVAKVYLKFFELELPAAQERQAEKERKEEEHRIAHLKWLAENKGKKA
ncbi:MAG: hypothetical protein J6W64_07955 [Bacilli bacterium]|nr:hypothetical protein [Bacilli bacterium]